MLSDIVIKTLEGGDGWGPWQMDSLVKMKAFWYSRWPTVMTDLPGKLENDIGEPSQLYFPTYSK